MAIQRLLVANRGEIAIRIISSARELGITAIAVYTSDDSNHAAFADEAIKISSPSDFTDIGKLVDICKRKSVDAVHPGYGFLSENSEFARALEQDGITFVGPTPDILSCLGDKTAARAMAESCGVPILPATREAISDVSDAAHFVSSVGYPVMVKAVDGAGGRGIRLIAGPGELQSGFARACGESSCGQVFLEKAAIEGYRHVEVQIVGDGLGKVTHLGERECSIQRRFQKVVEFAPSTIKDREVIALVMQNAIKLAESIRYRSLGTFEFLVHESRPEFYLLEVNPRLQVEHTVTEETWNVDLVRIQLLLAQQVPLAELQLPSHPSGSTTEDDHCGKFSMQLRVTAENPERDFTLSLGRITHFHSPSGRGVRVDSHLSGSSPSNVGTSYDSLLAKIVVTAPSFEEARRKGLRCLADIDIQGVKTNIPVLFGILSAEDFIARRCSIRWLETNMDSVKQPETSLLNQNKYQRAQRIASLAPSAEVTDTILSGSGGLSTMTFKKGDTFKLRVDDAADGAHLTQREFVVTFDRISRNSFPDELAADVTLHLGESQPRKFKATLTEAAAGSSAARSSHRQGDASNANHVILPLSGNVVEVLVKVGDAVVAEQVLMVVRQMKMEVEIRVPKAGIVTWICDVEDNEVVSEGMLICELKSTSEHSTVTPKL